MRAEDLKGEEEIEARYQAGGTSCWRHSRGCHPFHELDLLDFHLLRLSLACLFCCIFIIYLKAKGIWIWNWGPCGSSVYSLGPEDGVTAKSPNTKGHHHLSSSGKRSTSAHMARVNVSQGSSEREIIALVCTCSQSGLLILMVMHRDKCLMNKI